jgi:DNA-binding response OmpR family regulator
VPDCVVRLKTGPPPPRENVVRALIVDDSRAMRTILRRLCIESGYTEVTEAPDATSARVAAIDGEHDIVVVDWQLPDGTGLDLVRSLRADGETAPMLLLAPGAVTDAADVAREAGADDCVAKPFTGDDLRRRLAAAPSRR